MPRRDLSDRSIEGWDEVINPPPSKKHKPNKEGVEFADPKESAQNGYELARKVQKIVLDERKPRMIADLKKVVGEYFLNESEIEARS